jgi:hypothetical protein
MNRLAPLLAALTLAPVLAHADERPYAFTYEATTEAAGETEVELYETYYVPGGGEETGRMAIHQLEIGHGLTDQLDLALYTVFRSTTAKPFELNGFKLRGRYKLLTAATAPVDLVLYVEGEKVLVDDEPFKLEEKVIFGRDFGKVGVSVNLIAEQEFLDSEVVKVWGWSAGANVAVVDGLRVGVESFGEWKKEAGVASTEAFAGPSAVVALPFLRMGSINSAWLTVGVALGLNSGSDDVRARALLGVDW